MSENGQPSNASLFVISGPSGVGKGTLCRLLLQSLSLPLSLSVSATTRAMRPGEADGVDYHFKTREAFEAMINQPGALLEWAEYNGQYYGTPRAAIEERLQNNFSVLLEIETQGAMKIREYRESGLLPQTRLIFIEPPSVEILEQRLRGRMTNSDEDIERRLLIARQELALSGEFDHVIVNDALESAYQQLLALIAGHLS